MTKENKIYLFLSGWVVLSLVCFFGDRSSAVGSGEYSNFGYLCLSFFWSFIILCVIVLVFLLVKHEAKDKNMIEQFEKREKEQEENYIRSENMIKEIKKLFQDTIVEDARNTLTNNFCMEGNDFYFSDISVNDYPILFCKDALLYEKICEIVEVIATRYEDFYEYNKEKIIKIFPKPEIKDMWNSAFNLDLKRYTWTIQVFDECTDEDNNRKMNYNSSVFVLYGLNVVVEDEFFNSLRNDAKRWEVFLKSYNKPPLMELFGDKIKEKESKK